MINARQETSPAMAASLDVEALVRTHSLEAVGTSINTDYYAMNDDVLVAIPREGSKDTGETARDNRRAQSEFFTGRGKKGAIIIFFDRMTSQDKDARKVYEGMGDVLTCTALVGGTMLTRAMVSFFLGIARPTVPIKLFGEFEAALTWLNAMNRTVDRTLREGGAR